jgi:hypothetical protein
VAKSRTESEVCNKPILWQETEDPDFPYDAVVDGDRWRLRINDFPEEPLFTLFINDEEWGHFDDLPPLWTVPDNEEDV